MAYVLVGISWPPYPLGFWMNVLDCTLDRLWPKTACAQIRTGDLTEWGEPRPKLRSMQCDVKGILEMFGSESYSYMNCYTLASVSGEQWSRVSPKCMLTWLGVIFVLLLLICTEFDLELGLVLRKINGFFSWTDVGCVIAYVVFWLFFFFLDVAHTFLIEPLPLCPWPGKPAQYSRSIIQQEHRTAGM